MRSIKQNNMKDSTVNYYNQNAKIYFDNTASVVFYYNQNRFLKFMKTGSMILDFGSGSGRDTKYFLDKDFVVEAIDGSLEMCKLSTAYTGIKTKCLLFDDFNVENTYDGVWACASILHLPYNKLIDVIIKIANSLKPGGVLYTSFKYGDFEGMIDGRYFTYLDEDKMQKLIAETDVFDILEQWISDDVRVGRGDEKWINMILRKK